MKQGRIKPRQRENKGQRNSKKKEFVFENRMLVSVHRKKAVTTSKKQPCACMFLWEGCLGESWNRVCLVHQASVYTCVDLEHLRLVFGN